MRFLMTLVSMIKISLKFLNMIHRASSVLTDTKSYFELFYNVGFLVAQWITLLLRLYGPKISGENKASCYYLIMHLLKYDTRVWRLDWRAEVLYYPSFSCLITICGAVRCYFPHLYWPL